MCVCVCLGGFRPSIEEVPPSPVSRTSSVSVLEEEDVPEVTEVSSSDDLRPLHTSPDPSCGAEVRNVQMDGGLLIWIMNANITTQWVIWCFRACSASTCWKLKIWLLKTRWWEEWWRGRATRMSRFISETQPLRVMWSRRTSTPSGTRCMRWV